MRRLLPFLLLLAVFFNTAVGLPLHEGTHLAASAASVQPDAASRSAENVGDGQEETHAECATCLALAQAAQAWLPQPPALPGAMADSRVQAAAPTRPAPRLTARWPFASRDPPSLA